MKEKPSLKSVAFPDGGIYVMRSERIYLAAVCHRIGVNGAGPHKHNDWLSFELCLDGKPVIVDPGTNCYTSNMELRGLFRSAAYHNTVVIDQKEQIPINKSIFELINPHGEVRILRWETDTKSDLLEAEHTGYTRLTNPVVHRRRFVLDKDTNQVEITDTFFGEGEHTFEWYLHLDVGLECINGEKSFIINQDDSALLQIRFSGSGNSILVLNGWISKSYNRREKAKVINWRCSNSLESVSSNIMIISPS
jgi:hypothetical protein